MSEPFARLSIRVTPRASRDELLVSADGGLEVRVTAPPDGGKANAAACAIVAGAVGVPKSAVSVVRGTTARRKTLKVEGLDADSVSTAVSRLTELAARTKGA